MTKSFHPTGANWFVAVTEQGFEHARTALFFYDRLVECVCLLFMCSPSGCRGDTAALAVAHFPPEPLCNKRGKSGFSQQQLAFE